MTRVLSLFRQTLPLLCSDHQDPHGFSSDLQRLYAAIVAQGNTRKRKLSEQQQLAAVQPDLTPSSGRFHSRDSNTQPLVTGSFMKETC